MFLSEGSTFQEEYRILILIIVVVISCRLFTNLFNFIQLFYHNTPIKSCISSIISPIYLLHLTVDTKINTLFNKLETDNLIKLN